MEERGLESARSCLVGQLQLLAQDRNLHVQRFTCLGKTYMGLRVGKRSWSKSDIHLLYSMTDLEEGRVRHLSQALGCFEGREEVRGIHPAGHR